jgi:hypothetical protein
MVHVRGGQELREPPPEIDAATAGNSLARINRAAHDGQHVVQIEEHRRAGRRGSGAEREQLAPLTQPVRPDRQPHDRRDESQRDSVGRVEVAEKGADQQPEEEQQARRERDPPQGRENDPREPRVEEVRRAVPPVLHVGGEEQDQRHQQRVGLTSPEPREEHRVADHEHRHQQEVVERVGERWRQDEEQPELRLENQRPVLDRHRIERAQILEVGRGAIVAVEVAADRHLQQRRLPRELVAPFRAPDTGDDAGVADAEHFQDQGVARRRPALADVDAAEQRDRDRQPLPEAAALLRAGVGFGDHGLSPASPEGADSRPPEGGSNGSFGHPTVGASHARDGRIRSQTVRPGSRNGATGASVKIGCQRGSGLSSSAKVPTLLKITFN